MGQVEVNILDGIVEQLNHGTLFDKKDYVRGSILELLDEGFITEEKAKDMLSKRRHKIYDYTDFLK